MAEKTVRFHVEQVKEINLIVNLKDLLPYENYGEFDRINLRIEYAGMDSRPRAKTISFLPDNLDLMI